MAFFSLSFAEKEHPLLSMHLLIYAVQTFITTLACTVEMLSWEDRTHVQKRELAGLYVPYLALCKWIIQLVGYLGFR